MSEASKGGSVPEQNNNKLTPDYFGYYTRQVADLFSQDHHDDDSLPCSSKRIAKKHNLNPLFNDSIQLSDISKERLKVFLRQCVVAFTGEVDEISDSVISMRKIQYCLKNKTSVLDDLNEQPAKKKLRVSSSSSSISLQVDESQPISCSISGESSRNEDEDVAVERKGISDGSNVDASNVNGELYYMEQKLEELLDIVICNCRSMTRQEKVQLRRMIQNLPPRNLDRVAEIIRPNSKPLQNGSCEEIDVDLDDEDNVTLWRLYYYAEAVENARKLCLG